MDNYDEIISSLYDGELDGDSTSKAIELFSKDQNISKKIALYGVISAAMQQEHANVVPITNKISRNKALWLTNGMTAAASVLLTVFFINQPDFSRMGVDRDAQDIINLAVNSPEAQEVANLKEDTLITHVLELVNNNSNISDLQPVEFRNVNVNLSSTPKRVNSDGKHNFIMQCEKKTVNHNKDSYWKHSNKHINLVPLKDGRTLTLYGNLDQRTVQEILKNIK